VQQPARQSVVDSAAMAKRLRCYLGVHRYQRRLTEDGEPYKECRDCAKFRDMHRLINSLI